MKTLIFLLLALITIISNDGYSQAFVASSDHKNPIEPAFEKIYVQPCQLVTMPDGVYYYADDGTSTKVRGVLADVDGLYIITIRHQCPCCGRIRTGDHRDEEYGCPIYQRRVHPRIWSE